MVASMVVYVYFYKQVFKQGASTMRIAQNELIVWEPFLEFLLVIKEGAQELP